MSINSCTKGKRFERWIASKLRELFPFLADTLRRGQQHAGGPDSPDVVGFPGWHIEAKHVEKLNVWDMMAQAERDAAPGSVPVGIFKRNRSRVYVCFELDQILEFNEAINKAKGAA